MTNSPEAQEFSHELPEIDFSHVLGEISVNRRNPCEVIRELISNSYDAGATKINIFTIPARKGFVFVDNGTGLRASPVEGQRISEWRAFFSIGLSTKVKHQNIGYKCQGSKLCFASQRVLVLTRADGESHFRYKSLVDPKTELRLTTNIAPSKTDTPAQVLAEFIPSDDQTQPILERLNAAFFSSMNRGTIIVVLGFDAQEFVSRFTVPAANPQESYLWNYIQTSTRHGDVRVLRSTETGFPAEAERAFLNAVGYRSNCELVLWAAGQSHVVPIGYPWLSQPDPVVAAQIKNPREVYSLREGRFYERHARMIEFGGRKYCIILAIDGNRRALEAHRALDRQGRSISGMKLSEQRGAFISSNGIKACSINDIFESSELRSRFGCLGRGPAIIHYTLFIDGQFDLVTNRNDLAEESLQTIRNPQFLEKVADFFEHVYSKNGVFRKLIERLDQEIDDDEREKQARKARDYKNSVRDRVKFRVLDVEALSGKWLPIPVAGEEHWVGALYTMLSHLVPDTSPYKPYWPRAVTFSAIGVDALVTLGAFEDPHLKAAEYKYYYGPDVDFDHPFSITDYIVCWDVGAAAEGRSVDDIYSCYGVIAKDDPTLSEFGYRIDRVQSRSGGDLNHSIVVIGLRQLLSKTFKAEFQPERHATSLPTKKRKGGRG